MAEILIMATFSDADEGICQRLTFVFWWNTRSCCERTNKPRLRCQQALLFHTFPFFFFFSLSHTHIQPMKSSALQCSFSQFRKSHTTGGSITLLQPGNSKVIFCCKLENTCAIFSRPSQGGNRAARFAPSKAACDKSSYCSCSGGSRRTYMDFNKHVCRR